jgi:predicted metalloendopeptidase
VLRAVAWNGEDDTRKKLWTAGVAVAPLCATVLAVEPAALYCGAWGFDATGEDRSVKPGDDFVRFANGGWLDRTPIPADKNIFGLRALMTDLTEARLHALMEAAGSQAGHQPVSLDGKVGAFYKAFQDEARVERLGAEPLKPELDAIRMADTREALAGLMGHGQGDFHGSLFGVSVSVDRKGSKPVLGLSCPSGARPAGSRLLLKSIEKGYNVIDSGSPVGTSARLKSD